MEEKEKVVIPDEAISEETEKPEVKDKIDIKSMSEKEAKKLLLKTLEKNQALEEELEKTKLEAKNNKDSWYRMAADFDNFKKRNSETRMNAYKEGKTDVITQILVVGDNLDRALLMDLDEKTKTGIEMTAKQFLEILASMDVTQINPVGEDFNPDSMEAIMNMPKEDGEQTGKVKQVFKKGYKLGDKIIRYAQVVVVGE